MRFDPKRSLIFFLSKNSHYSSTNRFAVLWPGWKLSERVDVSEPGDGLVLLLAANLRLHFHQLTGRVGWKKAPTGRDKAAGQND